MQITSVLFLNAGADGKLRGQAKVKGVSGTWKDFTENVNGMASNLTNQVHNIAQVNEGTRVAREVGVDGKLG